MYRVCLILAAGLMSCEYLMAAETSVAGKPENTLMQGAVELFGSLNETQRGQALLPFDSPHREQQIFPGGQKPEGKLRAGIPISELNDAQRGTLKKLIAAFTSEYGRKQCDLILGQESNGLNAYFLAFFGQPGEGKTYAWRIAGHHLTLLDVEVANGEPVSVGPILLGSDPPKFFDDEEDQMIALYAVLTPKERTLVARMGTGISSKDIGDAGAKVGELSQAAQEKVKVVLDGRLRFFSEPLKARIEQILTSQGGIKQLQVVFFGEALKRCPEGVWDFKLGGPGFLCDYENSRKHIHLSLRGKLAVKQP